jgi:hypothetical protein
MLGAGQARLSDGSQSEGALTVHRVAIGLGLTQVLDAPHRLVDEVDLSLEVDVKRFCL